MTATYDPTLAAPKDRVRFHLGDTNVSAALVQDETIMTLLAEGGATPLSVAAFLARGIAAEFAQKVDFDVDGEGAKYSQKRKAFLGLAEDLDDRVAAERAAAADADAIAAGAALGGGIVVCGTSRSENVAGSDDTDRAANFSPLY